MLSLGSWRSPEQTLVVLSLGAPLPHSASRGEPIPAPEFVELKATTQLAEWIENDYKLTPNEVGIVLGTSVQYETAEGVDPQCWGKS
jgi:hypothetical protein